MVDQVEPLIHIDLSALDEHSNSALSCIVKDPYGKTIQTKIVHYDIAEKRIVFYPELTGVYEVYVFFGGKQLEDSPYIITVG